LFFIFLSSLLDVQPLRNVNGVSDGIARYVEVLGHRESRCIATLAIDKDVVVIVGASERKKHCQESWISLVLIKVELETIARLIGQ
jgi:hypothetical protein